MNKLNGQPALYQIGHFRRRKKNHLEDTFEEIIQMQLRKTDFFFNVKKEGNTHKGVFMRPNIHAFTIPVGDEETMKFSPTDEKYQSLIRQSNKSQAE